MHRQLLLKLCFLSIFTWAPLSALGAHPEAPRLARLAASCASAIQRYLIVPTRRMSPIYHRELGIEHPWKHEDRYIREAVLVMREVQAEATKANDQAKGQGLHFKTHGVVTGKLTLCELPGDIPSNCRPLDNQLWGHQGEYPVLARFSSASHKEQSDGVVDFVGLAVRVFLPNRPIDLLMTNKPVTTGGNIKVNTAIQRLALGNSRIGFLLRHPITALLLAAERHQVAHLQMEEYHSGNAVRIGSNGAMVFHTETEFYAPARPREITEAHLSQSLESTLSQSQGLILSLVGRLQKDPYLQDIDDGMLEWDTTPFPLGTFSFGQQNIDTPTRWELGRQMAFDPRGIQPLGLGRARGSIYEEIQKERGGNVNFTMADLGE